MKKIKTIFICVLLILLAVIMWRESHLNYDDYAARKTTDEGAESVDLTFPQEYTELVNDTFSFQAQVITGEAFHPDDVYEATAVIVYPDSEVYVNLFLTNADAANPDGTAALTSARTGEERNQFWWNDGDAYLLLEPERVYFVRSFLSEAVGAVARFGDYGETNNTQIFAACGEMADFSTEDAWNLALRELSELNIENYSYYDAIALDKETLNEQQELFMEEGLYETIGYEPSIEVFTEDEEGYYLYCAQTLNGLIVFDGYSVNDAAGNSYYSVSVHVTRNGIEALQIPVVFSFALSDEKVQLCSFETIVSTLKLHYGTEALTNPIEITKMQLVEYPISVGKNEFHMVPVWICLAEENYNDGFFISTNAIAINALTGEEMPELGQ